MTSLIRIEAYNVVTAVVESMLKGFIVGQCIFRRHTTRITQMVVETRLLWVALWMMRRDQNNCQGKRLLNAVMFY